MAIQICAAMTSSARAQAVIDPGRRLLDEQQRARLDQRLERSGHGSDLRVRDAVIPVKDAVCFPVKRIRVEGVSALSADILEFKIAPYTNSCMGQKSIEALIKRITDAYMSRGYITTRVYVPQQDLKSGVLRLAVVEGRIEAIQYWRQTRAGAAKPGPASKIWMTFPTKPGELLQLRDIEQGLDQLNRLSSTGATIDIKPGKEAGSSIVVVKEQKINPYRLRISGDSFGSPQSGGRRYKGNFEADDALGLAESFSASLLTSRTSNAASYILSIPYGYWTITASGSYSENAQNLNPITELFSQNASSSLKIDRLIYRDAESKWKFGLTAANAWNARFINGTELTPQRRGAVRANIEAEIRSGKNVFFVDGGVWQGTPWLWGDRVPAGSDRNVARTAFTKFDGSLVWQRPMSEQWRMSASVNWQYSDKPLRSPDQAGLGGYETIRGVYENVLTGDRALTGKIEITGLFPDLSPTKTEKKPAEETGKPVDNGKSGKSPEPSLAEKARQSLRPYAFVEGGIVRNIALQKTSHAGSAGFGLRLNHERVTGDIGVAFPFGQLPSSIRYNHRVYGTINMKLF
jgi:hemolysin activation/secretion protein